MNLDLKPEILDPESGPLKTMGMVEGMFGNCNIKNRTQVSKQFIGIKVGAYSEECFRVGMFYVK